MFSHNEIWVGGGGVRGQWYPPPAAVVSRSNTLPGGGRGGCSRCRPASRSCGGWGGAVGRVCPESSGTSDPPAPKLSDSIQSPASKLAELPGGLWCDPNSRKFEFVCRIRTNSNSLFGTRPQSEAPWTAAPHPSRAHAHGPCGPRTHRTPSLRGPNSVASPQIQRLATPVLSPTTALGPHSFGPPFHVDRGLTPGSTPMDTSDCLEQPPSRQGPGALSLRHQHITPPPPSLSPAAWPIRPHRGSAHAAPLHVPRGAMPCSGRGSVFSLPRGLRPAKV